jgi:hypothetical protein
MQSTPTFNKQNLEQLFELEEDFYVVLSQVSPIYYASYTYNFLMLIVIIPFYVAIEDGNIIPWL